MRVEHRRWIRWGLIATIVFQMTVLGVEYFRSVWPLWFGEEVTLKIVPVDPRDMFRGDYVSLTYEISRFTRANVKHTYKPGDVAYIALEKNGPAYSPVGMYKDPPEGKRFIQGRVRYVYFMNGKTEFTITYGIEAYFLPREKAREAEKEQREIRYARVFILPNGRAAIAGFDKY